MGILGPLLQPILSEVVDCIEVKAQRQAAGNVELAPEDPLFAIVQKLTLQAPPQLHPFLSQVHASL